MNEKFVTVTVFNNLPEAQFARSVLEADGIKVFLADEHIIGTAPHLAQVVGGMKLQVHESDYERAKQIMNDVSNAK